MMSDQTRYRNWIKSTASDGSGGCVELSFDDPETVAFRDSKDPDGPILVFSRHEYDCHKDGILKGEF